MFTEFIRVIATMIELEIRRLLHDQTEIFVRAVQPLLWLVIFGHAIGSLSVIDTGGISYIDYIFPGVLIQSTISIAIFFGLIMIWERESGILKKLIASPSPKLAIVIGRSMAAGVRALCQIILIIPLALLVGVRVDLNPINLILASLIIFISSGGFAAISMTVAALLKSREKFVGIGQLLIFPLFFASNSLYPIKNIPEFLQFFAIINPTTYIVGAVRALLITGDLSQLPLDILFILLFDAVAFTIAAWSFRKIVE